MANPQVLPYRSPTPAPTFGQPDAALVDLRDRLHNSLCAADALMLTTYGEAGDAFRAMAPNAQDTILSVIAEKVMAALTAAKALDQVLRESK